MDNIINDSWLLFGLAVAWFISSLLKVKPFKIKNGETKDGHPKYQIVSFSTVIALTGAVLFTALFLSSLVNFQTDTDGVALICLLACLKFVWNGSKQVAYKTQTGLFDLISGKPIETLSTGIHLTDPLLEMATISTNGEPDISADLQELEIEIPQLDWIQSADSGFQVLVKEISFMIELELEDVKQLFDIEGGAEKVRDRIVKFTRDFFRDEIPEFMAEEIDQDKRAVIALLADKLKSDLNKFCEESHYPYRIPDDSKIIIGDTQLEDDYYAAMKKKKLAKLEQKALDVAAKRTTKRLLKRGRELLPNGSEDAQLKAAQVSLGITPKTVEEKSFAVSGDLLGAIKTGLGNMKIHISKN